MGDFLRIEVNLFFKAALSGMIVGAFYDILRILRRVIHHGNIITNIEDFIYWNMAGIYIFTKVYDYNYGVIRGYFIGAVILGIFLYNRSIGNILVDIISKGINFLLDNILKKPLSKVIMVFKKMCKKKVKSHGEEGTKKKFKKETDK